MSPNERKNVYITGLGAYFPGEPIPNEEMEEFLGYVHGRPSRLRRRVLKSNGIQARHYALDRQGRSTHRNSEMARNAVKEAALRADLAPDQLDFLAAATTQPDLPVPGFASMVHGELGTGPIEIATLHGVCASGAAALQSARLQIRSGEKQRAVACASEFPSRLFKASRYEAQSACRDAPLSTDTDFLRFMLSDGAGAAVLEPQPARDGLSFRIDWIELLSHAGTRPTCMMAGANFDESGAVGESWIDYPSFEAAASDGAINLKQNLRLLEDVVDLGVDGFEALVASGKVDRDAIDWVVCHYSSEHLHGRVRDALRERDLAMDDARWFSNLTTRGNVGSASLFVLLEELSREKSLAVGQQILVMIPESGRFTNAFIQLTVVGPERSVKDLLDEIWDSFEGDLEQVAVLTRLREGTFSRADYRALLLNLRQQVIEGSRWIARAASSLDSELHPLRSLFLQHAVAEHRDFELLEHDYVAMGGCLEDIQTAQRNVGSEALASFMFERASRPNPFGLLGSMFIIEGLGRRRAGAWADRITEVLGLERRQVSFLRHHAAADEEHVGQLDALLGAGFLTPEQEGEVVRTARTTARLYRLQLEELNPCA